MNFCLLLKIWVEILVKDNKKLSSKYSKKLIDNDKQFATDAHKTASKREIQKTAGATCYFIGNRTDDRIIQVSKTSPKNNSATNEEDILRERFISSELRH